MNVGVGLNIIGLLVGVVVAVIFVVNVGSLQTTITDDLLAENNTVNTAESRQMLEENQAGFSGWMDLGISITFFVVIAGYWYLSFAYGRAGYSAIVGLIILILSVWVGGVLQDFAVAQFESMGAYELQYPITSYLINNLLGVATGTVAGSVLFAAMNPTRGRV